MRYDDRLRTALATAATGARAQALKWRQIVDLLAQRAAGLDDDAGQGALRWLEIERDAIPLGERMAAARAISGRRVPISLVAFFAADVPAVAAPVLRGARLSTGDWLSILPRLGPTARALLRHREDLPPPVGQALAAFGTSDLVLEGQATPPPPEPAPPPADGGQIRNLVARIEAFRQQRDERRQTTPPDRGAKSFRWESGDGGTLSWTDDRRGALIGLALAGDAGTATHAAVSARRPFRELAVAVPALGLVLLSGVPVFAADGRFSGYRGVGRPAAVANAPDPVAVREMVHELKTPLNAIQGFAEMIGGEFLGPAEAGQRARADEILAEARRLGEALTDIDMSVRGKGQSATDLGNVMVEEHGALEAQAVAAGARLVFAIEPGLPFVALDAALARRMLRRTVEAALAGARSDTVVRVSLRRSSRPDMVELRVQPAPSHADELTVLMVRGLIEGVGGTFVTDQTAWRAVLPSAATERRASA